MLNRDPGKALELENQMTLTFSSPRRFEACSKIKVCLSRLEIINNVLALLQLHMASITGAEKRVCVKTWLPAGAALLQ